MPKLRLMTHNIWNNTENSPAWAAKGFDCSAEARTPSLLRVYRELCPDVIGGQEFSTRLAELLSQALAKNYAYIPCGYTPILYHKERLRLLEMDSYTYPEKIEGYAGIFNDASSKSYCIAVLESTEDQKRFIFASTHLWWMKSPTEDMKPPYPGNYQIGSDEARVLQLQTLIKRLESYREKYGCPIFLVGDLNASYNSPAVQSAFTSGYRHAHDIATEHADHTVGYHYCFFDGFETEYYDKPFEWALDHILTLDAEDSVRRFERYNPDYYFPISDHSPAFVDIEL